MRQSQDPGIREVNTVISSQIDKNQYDPDQSEEERRDLRIKYRKLTASVLESRRDLIAQDKGDKLYRFISKSNVLFENVKNTQEAVLDSKLMSITAEINSQKTKSLDIGQENEVNLDELVAKMITESTNGTKHNEGVCLDWEHLGKIASSFGRKAHTMEFLLGPLDVEHKQIKRARANNFVRNKADLVTPTQLKQGDIQKQENETSQNVNTIYKILSEVQPVNYFKFVVNPTSFSQTVENIFYVSFLARKGVVGIDDSDGQPMLGLREVPNVESLEDVISKKQIIMGIDMKDFQDIIDAYSITEAMIPTRQSVQVVSKGKGWY
ncbi:Nse4 C-terminal-domain-containing protein [Gilbertella persicaria]|uniref:Nse4 C-terminal-domain-containing protein n=1 Tax=Gilbertella persicaria TaxID=101096 RepID=UPI00221FB115|nr:Nse4 C-terminal-domain-containing protein [Gilbertella persicaria]KAI8098328.1 Nse4 C-terminal-domain-containing protein [Gilbertella persicaria]